MANNGGGAWTGGQDASFLHNFDTNQHIQAGLSCLQVGRGYRKDALDATAAAEMRRLAMESKAKFVDGVGHLMAALTDPGLPEAHQVLLREQVILYLDEGEEMYDLAREAQESGAGDGKAVEYDAARAYEGRTPCLKEILETERSYLRYLETLIEVYVQPLREDRQRSFFRTKVLSESDFKQMFGSVEQLVPLHKMFLEALEARWRQRSPQKDTTVGDLFIKFAPFFKIYHPYCNNFEASTKLINSLLTSRSSFAKFLASASKNERTRGNSLQSLMIMPVQRIARYALLIENVCKKTPEGHPDRALLAEAAQRMKDTVGDINDTIKQHESRAKMFDVAYSFVPPQRMLVAAHRHFVKAGPLRYWRNMSVAEPDQLQAFLFNDIILFGQESGEKQQYTYVRQLKLQSVEDLADTSTHPNMFKIHGTVGQVRKTYLLSAGTNVDKSRWVEALYKCAETIATRVRSMSVALDRAHLGARAGVPSRVPSHPALTHAQSVDGATPSRDPAPGGIRRSASDRGARAGAGGAGAGAATPETDADDWCLVGAIHDPIAEDGEKEGGSEGAGGDDPGDDADFDLDGDLGMDFDASGVDLDDEEGLGEPGDASPTLVIPPDAAQPHRNSSLSTDSPAHALSARLAALSAGTDTAASVGAAAGVDASGGAGDAGGQQPRPLPPRPAQVSASSDDPAPPLPSRAGVASGASDGPPPLLPTRPRVASTASAASEGPPPVLPARPAGDADGKSDEVGDGGGAAADGASMAVCTVTADYTAANSGELTVALGDQVMLLDTRLGEHARVQDALGNVGTVPSYCIRVHL